MAVADDAKFRDRLVRLKLAGITDTHDLAALKVLLEETLDVYSALPPRPLRLVIDAEFADAAAANAAVTTIVDSLISRGTITSAGVLVEEVISDD